MTTKVVHVIPGLFMGGAEMKLYKLLRTMNLRRFEHVVVSLSDGHGPVAALIEGLGIPVHECGMRPGLPNPVAAFKVARLIRSLRPDLLHGWMYHGNLAAQVVAAVLPAGVPVIWNICDARLRHEKFTTALVDWLGARLSGWPDRIVSDSNASARVHQEHRKFSAKRWEVIPNGFDAEHFQPSEKARRDVRAELALPDDALLVGMIGRYDAVKDHACFLDAAALVLGRIPATHFLLVGRGVAGNRTLLDQIASLGITGSVHLLGERADMPRISAALDIAVSSSCSESLPSVIGEAMSSGVPCVVTDVGDSGWLVGDTGLVVPPRNPPALAVACGDLLSGGKELRDKLGMAGRRRIIQEFSLECFSARYEQVYEQALDRKRQRTSNSVNPTIVQVLTRLGAGGPPNLSVTLTREMAKRGYHSILVTGRLDPKDGDMSYMLHSNDRVHRIPEMSRAISPLQDFRALIALYRFLRATRPSIVHTHTAKAGALGRIAAWMAGVPVVVHTFHGNVLSHYFSRPANWAICNIERALARLTDGICVLAPQQALELVDQHRIASREKVHVVPLGMDLTAYSAVGPTAPNRAAIVVGWMGRFAPTINIPLLLAIVRETLRRTDRVRFVIAGDGPDAPGVKALADEIGPDHLAWRGWLEDVTPFLNECDLLIQTSRNEGTPVSLIQGMAAGRPFISTPAGGVVNMVTGSVRRERNGCRWFDNGILADSDPSAFASALCELSENPAEITSMGERAAEFARMHHSLPTMLHSLDALYSALLARELPASARAAFDK